MNGKQRYNHIPIPKQLLDVMEQATRKASQKRQQSRRRIRCALIIAICVMALLIAANIPFIAQAISPIPVLRSLIKMLEISSK